MAQKYKYDSFGNLKYHGHKVKQPYTFTGREYDSETGLYYYRARYYDAKLGRFISFDPILHPANGQSIYSRCGQVQNIFIPSFQSLKENPQNLHPYVYVGNNPVNLVDPLGLGNPYRCEILKTICMEYCATECEGNSEEYFLCLGWCEGPGKIACIRSPGRGKYPENPYCKDEDECKDKK